ncbi:MAG: VCBS repeat-containing protein [Gemmatimonadetes bacterium]|nr:VCBS repeat-containing protein [Gemmatimonadota bacterium]
MPAVARGTLRAASPLIRVVALLVGAGLSTASCGSPVDTSWHEETGGIRWRVLDVRGGGSGRSREGFTALRPSATGVLHRNDVNDEHAMANRNLILGAGVALGDVDGDGLADIFLASVETPSALYHNDGGFRFSEVTDSSGLGVEGLAIASAAFADVDGDGDLDLLAGTLGGPIKLWLNDGRGRFTDATATSGLAAGFAATALTLADTDGDGDLDLYVGTYKTRNALDAYPPAQRMFDQVVRKTGSRYEVLPEWEKEYRIEDRPDLGGVIRSQRAERDLFYLNDGAGHFTAVPIAGPRFRDENGTPLRAEPDFFTLSARFYDFTGDGAPDLYVCNDFEDPDQIWINDGRGGFQLVRQFAIRETSNTCMSVDFADVNRDGHVDIFTADMLSQTLEQRQRQVATHSPLPKRVGLSPDRAQWMQNMLLAARGDGTFAQVAEFAGVAASDWTWGSAFVDADLDGYEDLLAVNGHRWDVRDADTFERMRASRPPIPWNREQGEFPRLAARSVAFRNRGDLTFEDVSVRWRFGGDSAISNAIAIADLDGDGDPDVVVGRLDAPAAIYRNETSSPRIAVRLRARGANSMGVGAVVTVRAAGLPAQSKEITAGGYYLSGSEPMVSFATGSDTTPSIEVRWRDGQVDTVAARANRLYEIAPAARDTATSRRAVPTPADSARPLFADATALLGGHTHADALFDDFARQSLLPTKLSQLGPGVSWIDVDGDGREDLVVGAGAGGRLAVLRNGIGRFTPLAIGGPPARWDMTTVVPVPAGRALTLLAGQANYEAASDSDALRVPSVVGVPVVAGAAGAAVPVIAGDTASVGALALADVNGDGRLDLFVGARVRPGAWPLAARSRLFLRTEAGGWEPDEANSAAMGSLGLVTGAVWADMDGDGWPDLLVATEWGPVRLLRNERGRLRDVTKDRGLSETFSRWNGLGVGDFNGDGRLDIVATSWGRNTPWAATSARPHELHVGNFGGQSVGLLFARPDATSGASMPLESLARIGAAVPVVRERITSFLDYSRTTVADLLDMIGVTAIRVGATTYDHSLFLNTGDRFEVVPLPSEAQRAPAFGVVIADFDGDGAEDLFLAQNFSPTAMETPRFDAGAGLVLIGDGTGRFSPLGVRESGISVLGDMRGAAAADFDGDGRVDLAVSQNGAATTLWRNAGGTRGVRVRLDGGAGNPLGIGTQLAPVRGSARGAVREIHAGTGYWSMDAATTVLTAVPGDSVWIRWPGGREQTVAIPVGSREITVRDAGARAGQTSSR